MTKLTMPHSPLPSDLENAAPFLEGAKEIEPILFTNLSKLYERRAERMALLAEKAGEDGGEYLTFLQKMILAQKKLLNETPLTGENIAKIQSWMEKQEIPSLEMLKKANFLQKQYSLLFQEIESLLAKKHSSFLQKLSENSDFFAEQAAYLLEGKFEKCDPSAAMPLWAALSLCWAQAAPSHALLLKARKTPVPSQPACPCCGMPPVADMIMSGTEEGLRYEQCALCETRWHKVRSICPECFGSEHLDYWSTDHQKALIEIESCGDCQSYTKIFRLDRDPHQELCGDDLASFFLDTLVAEKGFHKRTLNPFALPLPA